MVDEFSLVQKGVGEGVEEEVEEVVEDLEEEEQLGTLEWRHLMVLVQFEVEILQ